ncbi:hypothetical protein DFP72DRAFT_1166636 [Ephemerocybe angulata]|uniref:F-box domain-containing protein n=1 Tax=Ephemerocybe angulata TaxID=980116 RepID=A0A8H6I8E5_9AGAR|nr:hypothetical protein DFP72DRAFT_1166636 [Tulosesus angulatus]
MLVLGTHVGKRIDMHQWHTSVPNCGGAFAFGAQGRPTIASESVLKLSDLVALCGHRTRGPTGANAQALPVATSTKLETNTAQDQNDIAHTLPEPSNPESPCRTTEQHLPQGDTVKGPIPSILVTHICSSWRTTALECRTLWSIIPFSTSENDNLLQTLLDRSGSAPLSVRFRSSNQPDQDEDDTDQGAIAIERFSLITSQWHRLRSLEILEQHHPTNIPLDVLQEHYSDGTLAPLLEKLVLVGRELPYSKLSAKKLLGGDTALRHLEVVNYAFPSWQVLPLGAALTHLTVECDVGLQCYGRPPIQQLWLALKRIRRNLEHLRVGYLLNIVRTNVAAGTPEDVEPRRIFFPKLRRLELVDLIEPLVYFLPRVGFPRSTGVDIEVRNIPSPPAWLVTHLVECLKGAWEGPYDGAEGADLKVGELEISERRDASSAVLNRSPYRLSRIGAKFSDGRGELAFSVQLGSHLGTHRTLLSTLNIILIFHSRLDLLPLRVLRLKGLAWSLPEEVWKGVFAPLPELGTIRFDESEVFQFLKWLRNNSLSTSPAGDSKKHLTRPSFPKLSRLELHSIHLEPVEDARAAARLLLDVLETRSALRLNGNLMVEVDIMKCLWFERGDYEKARTEIGATVYWDER